MFGPNVNVYAPAIVCAARLTTKSTPLPVIDVAGMIDPVGPVIVTSAGANVVETMDSSKRTVRDESVSTLVLPATGLSIRGPRVSIVRSSDCETVTPAVAANDAVTVRSPSASAVAVNANVPPRATACVVSAVPLPSKSKLIVPDRFTVTSNVGVLSLVRLSELDTPRSLPA